MCCLKYSNIYSKGSPPPHHQINRVRWKKKIGKKTSEKGINVALNTHKLEWELEEQNSRDWRAMGPAAEVC